MCLSTTACNTSSATGKKNGDARRWRADTENVDTVNRVSQHVHTGYRGRRRAFKKKITRHFQLTALLLGFPSEVPSACEEALRLLQGEGKGQAGGRPRGHKHCHPRGEGETHGQVSGTNNTARNKPSRGPSVKEPEGRSLRHGASTAGSAGWIPGQATDIPDASQHSQKV